MEIHRSAFKHGVDIDAIEHAVDHAVVIINLESDSDPPRVLAIGPNLSGIMLEIIWLELAEDRLMVIHAMALRPTFCDLLPPGEPT